MIAAGLRRRWLVAGIAFAALLIAVGSYSLAPPAHTRQAVPRLLGGSSGKPARESYG